MVIKTGADVVAWIEANVPGRGAKTALQRACWWAAYSMAEGILEMSKGEMARLLINGMDYSKMDTVDAVDDYLCSVHFMDTNDRTESESPHIIESLQEFFSSHDVPNMD